MGMFGNKQDRLRRQKEEKFKDFEGEPPDLQLVWKATWLVSRGNQYGAKRDLETAKGDYIEARAILPSHIPATLGLVQVLAIEGDFKEARRAMVEVEHLVEKSEIQLVKPAFYRQYGLVQYELEDKAAALQAWKAGLRVIKSKEYKTELAHATEAGESPDVTAAERQELEDFIREVG